MLFLNISLPCKQIWVRLLSCDRRYARHSGCEFMKLKSRLQKEQEKPVKCSGARSNHTPRPQVGPGAEKLGKSFPKPGHSHWPRATMLPEQTADRTQGMDAQHYLLTLCKGALLLREVTANLRHLPARDRLEGAVSPHKLHLNWRAR